MYTTEKLELETAAPASMWLRSETQEGSCLSDFSCARRHGLPRSEFFKWPVSRHRAFAHSIEAICLLFVHQPLKKSPTAGPAEFSYGGRSKPHGRLKSAWGAVKIPHAKLKSAWGRSTNPMVAKFRYVWVVRVLLRYAWAC